MTELYDVIVKNRQIQGENVVVLELESARKGICLPCVEAGAHVDLHLPNGLIRQYSLCQNPQQKGIFRIGILNYPDSRGGSRSAYDEIQTGMQLKVSQPKNLFPLHKARHSILVGGGIGITPLIAMAYALHQENASFELHYCAKSEHSSAFVDELKHGSLASYTTFHFKDQGANHREFFEQFMQHLLDDTHVYTCGPNGFMDWVINLTKAHKLPDQQVHKEYFQVEADLSGDAFDVVAKRSGKTIRVHAEETILSALAREGICIEMSCEQGVCGTCMCDVLEGEPDHRDVYFTDEEKADNEQILVCCSRAKSARLVLDI